MPHTGSEIGIIGERDSPLQSIGNQFRTSTSLVEPNLGFIYISALCSILYENSIYFGVCSKKYLFWRMFKKVVCSSLNENIKVEICCI